MKCFFLFLFSLFFGFFDYVFLLVFFVFFFVYLCFEFGGFWFGGLFFCDGLSFFLVFLSFFVFLFCVFSSLFELWGSSLSFGFLFVLFGIFYLLFLSFISFNIIIFYICFETIFMFMFFFVLVWGNSPERLQASFYMVFYTILVSFPFLVYLIFFEGVTWSLKFLFFYNFSFFWWFFMFFVFLVKLPIYGLHLWLPKAHVEAPVAGSMVLAGVLLKLGGYGFLRFSVWGGFILYKYSGYLLSFGILGGLVSCFLCLRQSDLKAFVAYSSVCHMGFGLAGIYCSSFFGISGGLFMLIAHGFCSSCLFYILYIFYERFHSRSLFVIKGLGVLVPSMIMSWFVFSVVNMGVPPSFSFFSEVFILVGLSMSMFFVVFFVGVFLFLAGLYGIFFFVVSCHGLSLFDGFSYNFSIREYLNLYGHFFPLFFISLYMCFFL